MIETGDPGALQTVVALFAALNGEGIRYCHWKSNLRLDRSLRGATDLDILIDPADAMRFQNLLGDFGVRRMLAPPGKRYPSIADYLGSDGSSGALFHLHVHYQLVLGEQFVKNYRLPLARHFLNSARPGMGVMVPSPELELVVLSLRALLKYRDRDAVKDILLIRSPGIPAPIRDEMQWLAAQTTTARVHEAAAEALGLPVADVIASFLLQMRATPRNGRELLRLRRSARTALAPYRRLRRGRALARYWVETVRRRSRWRLGPPRKMTLPGRGVSIGLLGADGAGKTTIAAELTTWLGRMMEVRGYYQGSKQPSAASQGLYLSFRAFRRAHRGWSARFGAENPVAHLLAGVRRLFLSAHYLSVGVDRYRRHRAGRRAVDRGAVVIYDRFPLIAPLDGPVIRQEVGGRGTNRLARLEESLYRRFQPPDAFLVLAVDPAISLQRKPDHDRAAIEAKAHLLQRLADDPELGPVARRKVVIDAGRPLAIVLEDARRSVWRILLDQEDAETPSRKKR